MERDRLIKTGTRLVRHLPRGRGLPSAESLRWHPRPGQRPAWTACSKRVCIIGGHSITVRCIAGGGTGASENALNGAPSGLARSLGCSTRPVHSLAREPETKIAWKVACRSYRLTRGKPNGEYLLIIID